MADKCKMLKPGSPADVSYDLPACRSSATEPAPSIREPGSPASRRAPGRKGAGVRLPGRGERPAPDDRLARPEAGEEYVDGRRIEVMAGDAGHAGRPDDAISDDAK